MDLIKGFWNLSFKSFIVDDVKMEKAMGEIGHPCGSPTEIGMKVGGDVSVKNDESNVKEYLMNEKRDG
jgi:hypothetical protein